MLDGSRYFAEFPDEHPALQPPLSADVRDALAALEREISSFTGTSSDSGSEREGAPSTSGQSAPRSE